MLQCIPVPQVVIFSAPAPEGIRKAIDFPKLFYSQTAHSAKKLCVGKPEKDSHQVRDIELSFLMNLSLFSCNAGDETQRITSQQGRRTEHQPRLLTGLQQAHCTTSTSTELTQCPTEATVTALPPWAVTTRPPHTQSQYDPLSISHPSHNMTHFPLHTPVTI